MAKREISFVGRWRRAVLASDLSDAAVRVAVALGEHMNGEGRNARPGLALLARECGLARRMVERHRAALVRLGWLDLVAAGGSSLGGQRRPNVYAARLPGSVVTATTLTTTTVSSDGGSVADHRQARYPTTVTTDARPPSVVTTKAVKEAEKEAGGVLGRTGTEDRTVVSIGSRSPRRNNNEPPTTLDASSPLTELAAALLVPTHRSAEHVGEMVAVMNSVAGQFPQGRERVAAAAVHLIDEGLEYPWGRLAEADLARWTNTDLRR